jgi:hypothetical protein
VTLVYLGKKRLKQRAVNFFCIRSNLFASADDNNNNNNNNNDNFIVIIIALSVQLYLLISVKEYVHQAITC